MLVQAVVDEAHQVIVATRVSNKGADKGYAKTWRDCSKAAADPNIASEWS